MNAVLVPFPVPGSGAEPSCASHDSSWWFEPASYPNAIAICRRCPMRSGCLAEALQSGEHIGVWGGLTPEQRVALPDAEVVPLRARAGGFG